MRRVILASVAALALPLGFTVAASVPASAATLSIRCTHLSGSISGSTAKLSGCSGNTGKSGTVPIASFASGTGTITWANGKTTSVSGTVTSPSKDETETKSCAAGSTEYLLKGKVTADTTGSATVGGTVHAEACLSSTGTLSLEPGTKAVI
jgi:predicted RecA/RadA family phage recombinase